MMTLPRWRSLTPILILWPAFVLRLYHLAGQSIWWDEGHSIFVANQPILQIPTLPAMDVHPPAYFAVLHLWMNLAGRSEFALRYLSVIFSLLTVALLWRFAAHIQLSIINQLPIPKGHFVPGLQSPHYSIASSTKHQSAVVTSPLRLSFSAPFLTALLAALSPLYVAYAQEVRSYAMITFLALVSTFALWQILFAAAGSQRTVVILYIISTAACLYTHYFTIFLLIFQNLAWLAWVVSDRSAVSSEQSAVSSEQWSTIGGRRSAISGRLTLWIISQAGILLLFTPQLLLAFRQVTGYTNPNLNPPGLPYFISRSWQAYTVGLTIDPTPARWGMWLLLILLLAVWLSLFIQIWKFTIHNSKHLHCDRKGEQAQVFIIHNFLFFLAWFLLPLAAYFIVLQRQPSFEPRYLMPVTPALFLLLGVGLNQVASGKWQVRKESTSHVSRITHHASRITHHVSRITHHASRFTFHVSRFTLVTLPLLIFVIALHSYFTNETYFKDDSAGVAAWLARETTVNDIVYIDVPHPFHYYAERIPAPTRYLFVDIHTAADILNDEAAGRNRLFWVTWRGSDTDPRRVIPFLAEKSGRSLGQLDFRGYRVTWFSLPQDETAFSLPTTLTPAQAMFGDVLRLDGVAYGGNPSPTTALTAGESGWATLHFTLLRETEVDYRVSLRLRSEAGQVVAQIDKDLLNDRHFHTSAWPLADPALNQTINVYTLPLPVDTPPGDYRLEAVVYSAQPPYPSEGVAGHESADGVAAILGSLTVRP